MLLSVLSFRLISSSLPFALCAREWTLSSALHLLMSSLKVPPSSLFVFCKILLRIFFTILLCAGQTQHGMRVGSIQKIVKVGVGGCLIPHMSEYDVSVFLCTVGNV